MVFCKSSEVSISRKHFLKGKGLSQSHRQFSVDEDQKPGTLETHPIFRDSTLGSTASNGDESRGEEVAG